MALLLHVPLLYVLATVAAVVIVAVIVKLLLYPSNGNISSKSVEWHLL